MTIMIVSFTPKEIIFVSDTYRYFLKEGTTEDVLNHKLEIDHTNLKDHIESYETNCPKIHEGLICGGDGRFSDIIKDKNTPEQIIERLKHKGKLNAYWSCHIGELGKLTSIIYKNGEIETQEQTTDNIWFDSFALEIKEIFFKKYIAQFYMANTQEKIKIINEFFKEITALFNGLAGGTPQIAILNEKGFNYITTQNFTAYSLNWMPEKIETALATDFSWSSTEWTDILELPFTCDSKMLLFIHAYVHGFIFNNTGNPATIHRVHYLTLDGNGLPVTDCVIGGYCPNQSQFNAPYSVHTVAIVEKGSHTIKIRMRAMLANTTAWAFDRRLSILKGFYQGGTT
jgi:hypothetical protein